MYARHFQFNAFRHVFTPSKRRNPLLRLGIGLLGLALLAVLVFVSVFVGAAMIAGGLLYKLLRQRGKPVARDGAMEGEYRVVRKQALPLPR